MAEIEIERRPRRNGWKWVILVVVIAALAVAAWLVLQGDVFPGTSSPAAEETSETYTAPPSTTPQR